MVKRLRRQRSSGALRQLPSGRWQPSLPVPGGKYVSLGAFDTRAQAERALAESSADRHRGMWVDPRHGHVLLEDYAQHWLENRVGLRPRTQELYEILLRLHILPMLGQLELGQLTPAYVRQWHASLTRSGQTGAPTVAKAYRLLKTIYTTAVEDEIIGRNPCVLKGAGVERSPERPVVSIADVDRLVAAAPEHMRALILTATYTALRFGELAALTRRHVDLGLASITVVAAASELRDGTRIIGEPKTYAGRRTVSMPAVLIGPLSDHLDRLSEPGLNGAVFVGPKGGPLRRGNFNVTWRKLADGLGMEGLRFHDLRHTGNTLAAMTGASTKELMSRMGHASTLAAMIYQHATADRDRALAERLNDMIVTARSAVLAPAKEDDQDLTGAVARNS